MSPIARYPGARWSPVDRYQSGSLHVAMTPRRLVFHTAVTNASAMHDFFNVSGRATPHFYVNADGAVEQFIDTDYRGSANLDGNWNVIGVETWDGYGASWNGGGAGPRWTDAQVEALAKLAAWCFLEHGIPLHALRSSRRLGRGVGWHRLGIEGNFPADFPFYGRKPFGEHWSLSTGKVCPTDTRIRQTVGEILPRARRVITAPVDKPTPTPVAEPRDQGRVKHARKDLRQAAQAMKPGKRRNAVRAALRLIRGLLATPTANSRPHEESNKETAK